MPSPPPKPALELAGQALEPTRFSASSLQVVLPVRSSVTPAGPNTLTCSIGDGMGPVVEAIVALPNAFVGPPSFAGEKPAWVICTVSAACAPVAQASSAAALNSAIRIRRDACMIVLPSLPLGLAPRCPTAQTPGRRE